MTAFNDLKLSKKYKYIVFKLSDDNRQIIVEEASADKDWENFREKLINATSKSKSVCFRASPFLSIVGSDGGCGFVVAVTAQPPGSTRPD